MNKNTRFAFLFLLICVSLVFTGCGKKVVKTEGVVGKVTFDGQPLPNANVYFIPVDKGSGALDSVGHTDENGAYKLQTLTGAANAGTTPGKYLVYFDAQKAVETGRTETVNGEEVPVKRVESILPKKYRSEKTSGYEVEVVPGPNEINFDLTSK